MAISKTTLFALSGLIPLLGLLDKDPTLLIYSLFVMVFALRSKFIPLINKINLPATVKFVLLFIISGFVIETFAWLGEYLQRAPEPKLLHPQLIPDLLISIGLYGGLAVAWTLLLKRYRFTVAQIFFIQGLYGVFIEQRGAVFLMGLSAMPAGLLFWLYVFLVYGSVAGLPFVLLKDQLISAEQRDGRAKYVVAIILIAIVSIVVLLLWGLLTDWFIPEPKPIWQSPLW